jgi:hypothetical protein
VATAAAAQLLGGCVYQFTNEHITRPEGIQTIAVEAVYDTSREVLPHELLWQALQDALGSSGYVRLAPQSSADALVRAHLRQATVAPLGGEKKNGQIDKDPSLDSDEPPKPSEFQRLTQASEYRERGRLTMVVDVEVWSLRTRTLLMKRSYPLRSDFYAVQPSEVTPRGNNHLRYEEAIDVKFQLAAQAMSQRVVQDLFVR